MCSVRLVRQHEHVSVVRQLHYGAQVGANAVVGGIVDEYRDRVRVLVHGFLDLRGLHAKRDADMVVNVGVYIYGLRAAQNECVYDAFVDVPGQYDLVARLASGEDHALHSRGGAAYHKVGVRSAERVGCKLLGIVDDGDWVAEVIQRLHRVHIETYALLTKELYKLRVAASALMSGNIEGNHALLSESFQRFIYGG